MNSTGISSFFGSDWLGAFLIIAVLFGGGGWFGGNRTDVSAQINEAINNQSTQQGLRDILLSSANNNYETAQLINGQTNSLMQ
jgi:protein involved in ribonucleotide reduction